MGKNPAIKILKKAALGLGILAGVLIVAVLVYVGYVYFSYSRIEDNQVLSVRSSAEEEKGQITAVTTGSTYRILTYNIGFGAYTQDFSFFMDGGEYSRAKSRESVLAVTAAAAELADGFDADFLLWQEVDVDADRSWHVNQSAMLDDAFSDYFSDFAVNFDSAYLFYPFTQPHGKSKSGMAVYSKYPIESAVRRSFPISTSLTKFFDLDRCYSVSRIPADNGRYLCLYAVHMSAYGNNEEIRAGQIQMLCEDMEKEYLNGNYVVCGGDFNHDLKLLEEDGTERESWAYPFPREALPEGFDFCIDFLAEEERNAMWNSSRNADMEYIEGTTYTITLDGFIISDNVICETYENIKTDYRYSDHDPVVMTFQLSEQ